MRLTEKVKKAIEILNALKIDLPKSSRLVYELMKENNFWWSSETKQWSYFAPEENDPASRIIKIRVWGPNNEIICIAQDVIKGMNDQGYNLAEQSEEYPCRPPKGNESRVYLSFLKE